jgi:hypothetical protein
MDDGAVPALSADGSQVMFVSDEPLLATDLNTVRDLYLRNTITGALMLVTAGKDGRAVGTDHNSVLGWCMSADGHTAWVNADLGEVGFESLFAVDLSTGAIQHLLNAGKGIKPLVSAVSADGNRGLIVTGERLTADDTDSNLDAYLFDRSTGKMSRTSAGLAATGWGLLTARLTGDGRVIMLLTMHPSLSDIHTGIGIFDPATGALRTIDTGISTPSGASDIAISADGSHVVFSAYGQSFEDTLDTGVVKNFPRVGDVAYYTSLSADGRYVVFQSADWLSSEPDWSPYGHVWRFDTVTGQYRYVDQGADGLMPGIQDPGGLAVSADGRYVTWADAAPLLPSTTPSHQVIYRRDMGPTP